MDPNAHSSTSDARSSASKDNNDEEAQGVTMLDVLKEEMELEKEISAVLGASDDKNCTYSKGYVKRQALYACLTCIPKSVESCKLGGICLACSYHCHEGHELIELYTKRYFRCDCGNSKYPDLKCNLEPNKDLQNDQNSYNQNFRGLYCTCKRPYPDPDNLSAPMVQCLICEDWYHDEHLGKPQPLGQSSDSPTHLPDYVEMACFQCMNKHNFLAYYAISDNEQLGCVMNGTKPNDGPGNTCILNGEEPISEPGTSYFLEGWRKRLCHCTSCKELYDSHGLSFLLDDQESVCAYVEQGRVPAESQYEQGMKALSNLNRIHQVEAIQEYNDMKQQLMEYLQKFAKNKKLVREEDIKEFFSGMQARKKQRLNVQIQHFCR